ncbi:MAG: hypothetical protein PHS74_12335 [Lachnospiraceae bacterium]|nr:hypothetical protein [Lachnospiraceae bacterium]
METKEYMKRLEAYNCDVRGALERCLGDEKFYLSCIHMVLADKLFEELGESLSTGSVKPKI